MPSISRVLSAFAFGLLVAAAPAVAVDPTVNTDPATSNTVKFSFDNADEILTYNGDGSSKDFPLVTMLRDVSSVAPFGSSATTGELFAGVPFHATKAGFLNGGANRNKCALVGEIDNTTGALKTIKYKVGSGGETSVQTATNQQKELRVLPSGATQVCVQGSACSNTAALLASYKAVQTGKVYKFSCGTGNSPAPLFIRFQEVSTSAAPIIGMLDWVSDAPVAPSQYDPTSTVTTAPGFVHIPFLSNLKVSALNYVGSTTNANLQEPNYFAQVVEQDLTADGNLAKAIVSFQVATNTPADVTNIIGCFIKNADGTYTTVNDQTQWPVPTSSAHPVNDFSPECYFVATNGGTQQASNQDTFTAKVVVHLRVLAPCVEPSLTNTYSWAAVNAALQPQSKTDNTRPIIWDNYNLKTGSAANQTPADKRSATLQLTGGTSGSWPFYSFYQASDNVKMQMDPILTYLVKTGKISTNPDGTAASPITPTDYALDVGHPILCREVDPIYKLAANGVDLWVDEYGNNKIVGYTPDSEPRPLVNDQTKFGIGKHWVQCQAWDAAGNPSGVVEFFLTVLAPIEGGSGGGDCNIPGACGDPQFTGFLGQSFQVHGVSGQVYNVLSTPHFQYNALFTYLSEGKCRKGTQCFSHPGNYFGQVGLLLRSPDGKLTKVQVIAGAVDAGLTVLVDEVPMPVSASRVQVGDVSLKLATPFELVVEAPEFSMQLSNSDMFINQNVAINTPLLRSIQQFKRATKNNEVQAAAELEASLPHGLLGQTWQHKTYANRWKYIQGTLFEYSVADGLLGADFKYNRF